MASPPAGQSAEAGHPAHLPSVDRVLGWPTLARLTEQLGRTLVRQAVRDELAAQRAQAQRPDDAALLAAISQRCQASAQPRLRPVFNLSGTVLHTNLGRAPLPAEAISAIAAVAGGASALEYDLATGQRGERDDAVAGLLCQLTGAEAATVVNNTAATLLLVLAALAPRREVIVSRGELIEIGGSFRLPDLMRQAGCKLVEVGTTNRTHLRDHAQAIGPRTALLLKVHASNYQISGFSAAADEAELARLAHSHGLPLVVDLGSGALLELAHLGLPAEPTPRQTLARGADLVLFSGDKLLGGPQAGIVVGRADLVAKLRKHPLKRALRCDKLTLAALEAVLRLYQDPDRLLARLPTLRLLTRPAAEIERTAQCVLPAVAAWAGPDWAVTVAPVRSQIGSGALPVDLLPSHALRLLPVAPGAARSGNRGNTGLTTPRRGQGTALKTLAARLRALPQPVIGRVADGALWLDLRCLDADQQAGFVAQLTADAAPPWRDGARPDPAPDTGAQPGAETSTSTSNNSATAPLAGTPATASAPRTAP